MAVSRGVAEEAPATAADESRQPAGTRGQEEKEVRYMLVPLRAETFTMAATMGVDCHRLTSIRICTLLKKDAEKHFL